MGSLCTSGLTAALHDSAVCPDGAGLEKPDSRRWMPEGLAEVEVPEDLPCCFSSYCCWFQQVETTWHRWDGSRGLEPSSWVQPLSFIWNSRELWKFFELAREWQRPEACTKIMLLVLYHLLLEDPKKIPTCMSYYSCVIDCSFVWWAAEVQIWPEPFNYKFLVVSKKDELSQPTHFCYVNSCLYCMA